MRLTLALACLAVAAGFGSVKTNRESKTFRTSDGATIGFHHQKTGLHPKAPTLFILPGYTLTAEGYMRWFAEQFASLGFDTVSMDYRGFGLSLGKFTSKARPEMENIYRGVRISRFAMDAHEVMGKLGKQPEQVLLMAHSIGVHVASEYVSLFNPPLLGYIILDQPPKFTRMLDAAEASFDVVEDGRPVEYDAILQAINGLMTYNETGVERTVHAGHEESKRLFHYPGLVDFFNSGFHSVEVGGNQSGYVTYTEAALVEWMSLTSYYSDMNGKLVALTLGLSNLQDYTDVYGVIAERGYPCFVYGGKASVGPIKDLEWIWRQLQGSNRLSQALFFRDDFGVHTPWLNPEPTASYFYANLTRWASRVLDSATL